LAAILSLDASVTISWDFKRVHPHLKDHLHRVAEHFLFAEESEEEFCKRVLQGGYRRVRLMSPASSALREAASLSATFLDATAVLSHGRFELLHYLREISFSIDYHRYGNLGLREQEERKALH
jgi:RHH-type proline utilization regulon transcriptional repressor/proline dehydrogenase/delta 1-pyrroline-5-carboxylate dehydrogenase